jgi:hypothetical protein
MNSKFQIDQHGLVFARNGECWQIQIIGEGVQNQAALAELKDTIFGSIRISTKN